MNTKSPEHYVRMCYRILESTGATADTVLSHQFATDKARFEAWTAESILYALQAKTQVARLRGLLQAKEYVGRLGGWCPGGGTLSDAMTWIQHQVEDELKQVPQEDRIVGPL